MKDLIWKIYPYSYDLATLNFSAYKSLVTYLTKVLDISDGDNILNLGSGTGNLEKVVSLSSKKCFCWLGLDISDEMLKRSNKKVLDNRFTFKYGDLDVKLKIETASIDKILSIHSLYVVKRYNYLLKECYRVLKPGGILIIVNPKSNANISEMMKYERKVKGIINFYYIFMKTIPALLINMIITKLANRKIFQFLSKEKLSRILVMNKFKIVKSQRVYANQSVLIIARK